MRKGYAELCPRQAVHAENYPRWRGVSFEKLRAIVEMLSSASYHYADDSASEWGEGAKKLIFAAKEVNRLGLDYEAMLALYSEKVQLVGFSQFMNAVLKDVRLSALAKREERQMTLDEWRA